MTHARVLPIPNAINLRELGGYPTADGRSVRWGKVLRSGSLSYLDLPGEQALANYGVNTVVDLRSESEVSMSPDHLPTGTDYHHLSVYPLTDQKSFLGRMKRRRRGLPPRDTWQLGDAYLEMLTDTHALGAYRQMFQLLLRNTQPKHALVFHCSAGKDRTGIGAMMLEGLLGVPQQIMRQDYVLTNMVLADPKGMSSDATNSKLLHGASAVVNQMNALAAGGDSFDTVAKFVNAEYGTWQKYAGQELKLDKAAQSELKRIYLE